MARLPDHNGPDSQQSWTDYVRAMPENKRHATRTRHMNAYTAELGKDDTLATDMAIAFAHMMEPKHFKERIDEMFFFLRLRSILTELDALLEIAEDLSKHLEGQIANSYAACLDTRINETHERLAGAIMDLRSTAQSNWQLRNAQFQVSECWDTDVGATEKKAVAVHEVQTTPIIEPLPEDPNEWINRNEEDFEAVWDNGKALRQAIQGWKPKSDRELQYLKDETSSIWEIAGNFDATELVMFGFQGV